jgi:two-component system sensor histidine kinase KdpD
VVIRAYLRHPVARYGLSLALVATFTSVVALVRLSADVGNASMLYLLAVMASALMFGSGPAILTAIASFAAFNFFFIEPRYTLTVADQDEWVALGLLLVTGVITGQLAAALRDRARDAERREKEAVVLYDVVRLMSEPELARALTSVAERLRAELSLAAVVVAVGDENTVRAQADTGDSEAIALAQEAARLPEMILGSGQAPTASERGRPGRWIRVMPPEARTLARPRSDRVGGVPVSLKGTPVGSIILVRGRGTDQFGIAEDRLLSTVAHQLGLTLERLRLQRQAMEAEVLRRTDELRTALINAVSHDLRTPLASIIASAGSLLQEDVRWKAEDRREFTQAIVEEAERLDRLVGNLLDLSRIEAGSIRPEKGWYDLGSLANEVAGRLRRLAASHALVLDVPDDLPPARFDYVEIDQVLTNLIENAAKYTPAGSEIRVSLRAGVDAVRIEVADNGPGIPATVLPHLFKPFYRAPGDYRPRGSGLGLAVARGLVEAHGGRIWAENREEGGARFVFTLPVTERPAAAA